MIESRAFKHQEFRNRCLCSIAAAVLGAGALSAGSSIWGANTAANAQTGAANAAIANQQSMFNTNSNNLSPFINAGTGGISQLQNWLSPTGGSTGSNALSSLLALVTPGPNQNATLAQTPGYQFAQSQGNRQILNSLAARGLGGSPGAITQDIGSFSSGLASTTFNSQVQNLLNTFTAGAGGLQGLVNTGEGAAGALAGVGTNTANSITGSLTGAGNASAAAANATGAAGATLGNAGSTAALLNQLTGTNNSGSAYGALPATGTGSPTDAQSNQYALSQGINPYVGGG